MLALALALLMQASPAVGSVAPSFTVTDVDGKKLDLDEMVKKGRVILAFFPKAFTGGCTKELTRYQLRHDELQKAGGTLIAVSTDDAETLRKFKSELKASYSFVADPKGQLVALYDTEMALGSLAARNTFVIGEGRKVLETQKGSDAIDPTNAIKACELPKQPPAKKE